MPTLHTVNSLIWTNNVSKGGKVYCTNTSCDTKRPFTSIQLTKLVRMTKIWLAHIDSTSSSSLDSATSLTNPTATLQPQDLEASIQHHVTVDMPQQQAIALFEHHPTMPPFATDVLAQLSSLQQQQDQQQQVQDR
jgi:lysyl-tRNA synthetase class II